MRERPYFSMPNVEPIYSLSHSGANGQQAYQTNGFPMTPTGPFEFQNPSFPQNHPAEPMPSSQNYGTNNSEYQTLGDYFTNPNLDSCPITGINVECLHNDPNAVLLTFDYKETTTLKKIFQCDIEEGAILFRFASRFYRDNFLLTWMMAKGLRYLSVSVLSRQLEKILRDERPLSILKVDDLSNSQLVMMDNLRRGLTNMIDINVDLLDDNRKVNKAVEVLEEDISFLVKEFTLLFDKVKNNEFFKVKSDEQAQYLEDLNKSIIDRTLPVGSLKDTNPNTANRPKETSKETIARLERELVETKKLNVLLMRKIESNKKRDPNQENLYGENLKGGRKALDGLASSPNFGKKKTIDLVDTGDVKVYHLQERHGESFDNILGDLVDNIEMKISNNVNGDLSKSKVGNGQTFSGQKNQFSGSKAEALISEQERKEIVASLLKNTEERYGDYVRELQGRNIGLTQELDDSRKERGKL
jgi:hypothetical protein